VCRAADQSAGRLGQRPSPPSAAAVGEHVEAVAGSYAGAVEVVGHDHANLETALMEGHAEGVVVVCHGHCHPQTG
jgi:hypothetical protein